MNSCLIDHVQNELVPHFQLSSGGGVLFFRRNSRKLKSLVKVKIDDDGPSQADLRCGITPCQSVLEIVSSYQAKPSSIDKMRSNCCHYCKKLKI